MKKINFIKMILHLLLRIFIIKFRQQIQMKFLQNDPFFNLIIIYSMSSNYYLEKFYLYVHLLISNSFRVERIITYNFIIITKYLLIKIISMYII